MKKSMLFALSIVILTLSLPSGALAGSSPGGRTFSVHEMNLLDGWVGKNISLNNLYSRGTDVSPSMFHAAADNAGPTLVVLDVTITSAGSNYGKSFTVGGYNPQSWTSNGGYVHTNTLGIPRDAFIFNLTDESVFFQDTNTDFGAYQTYNHAGFGPSFGSSDLWTTENSLLTGTSRVKSYGLDASLWGGAAWNGTILPGNGTSTVGFNINALDVYAVSAAASPVPAPTTVLLLSSGLAGLFGLRGLRRKE